MMRGLFGDVVATSLVWIIPIAGKGLAENGIQRLFHATGLVLVGMIEHLELERVLRWLDMPATEIELDNSDKTLQRVLDFRHR
jgi:hypothetical protein